MSQNEIRGETQIISESIPYDKHKPATFSSGGSIFTDKEDHSAECNGSQQFFALAHESFPRVECWLFLDTGVALMKFMLLPLLDTKIKSHA